MSSDSYIRVENLSKVYRISHLAGQRTLRDAMHHGLRLAWRRLRWNTQLEREAFWALRDVSFEVRQGQVLGVVGRNGAGKSTLLKVLSRITEPTKGRIRLRGRVASLLEVGTGFHPELSGRDNIFLNGAVLGMSRAEIRRKFDEIVAFSEVERFLDTPVKRYSSGMYVRLAFAVAAHLEPEILIVDEVLAVGDAEFQKKCLSKMESVSRNDGRIVLFVSHNMSAVLSLCNRALLLDKGQLATEGTPEQVVNRYLQVEGAKDGRYVRSQPKPGTDPMIVSVELRNAEHQPCATADNGRPLGIQIEFTQRADFNDALIPSVVVRNSSGIPVFQHHSRLNKQAFHQLPTNGQFTLRIAKLPLPAASYYISVALLAGDRIIDQVENALELRVIDGNFYAPGERSPASHGMVLVEGEWSVNARESVRVAVR